MNATLDGYIAARGDDIGWSVPSAELHQWFNDRRCRFSCVRSWV